MERIIKSVENRLFLKKVTPECFFKKGLFMTLRTALSNLFRKENSYC